MKGMATKTLTLELPAGEAAQFKAAAREIISKISQARKRMKRDQAEIEKSQKRTRALLAELSAMMR